jgi:hypothetical protein
LTPFVWKNNSNIVPLSQRGPDSNLRCDSVGEYSWRRPITASQSGNIPGDDQSQRVSRAIFLETTNHSAGQSRICVATQLGNIPGDDQSQRVSWGIFLETTNHSTGQIRICVAGRRSFRSNRLVNRASDSSVNRASDLSVNRASDSSVNRASVRLIELLIRRLIELLFG